MVEAIRDINKCLELSDPLKNGDTLLALKSPDLSLRSITNECSEEYHVKLSLARQEKITSNVLTQR